MCETILTDYVAAYQLERVALRYFNASGDDPDGDVGEDRDIETHLIPRAMMALQGYIDDFEVFGSDFPTHDGTAVRDYIHVSDLADAHILALRYLLNGGTGRRVQPRRRTRLFGQRSAEHDRRRVGPRLDVANRRPASR